MTVYLEMSFVYMQTSGWTYENEDSFYSYAYFSFAFVDHFSFRLRNAFRKKKQICGMLMILTPIQNSGEQPRWVMTRDLLCIYLKDHLRARLCVVRFSFNA